jgi:sugar diacid utilization regulator
VRVRDLLDVPDLGLRLLSGAAGLDRVIRHVFTTDLPDPGRYLTSGDLVLTGLIWCREPGDADQFVTVLAAAGATALGAGEALGDVPPELVRACIAHGLTLLAVPAETSFATITDEVARKLDGDRATAMTRVLGRRRLLLSAVAQGAGLDAMFALMGRDLGPECWLLTGTGRMVGGTGAALPAGLALQLACAYVKADRLPGVTAIGDAGPYSLFGVGGEPRLTSWFLACAGKERDWAPELRESVAELVADVALERARLDAGRTGDRKLAEAIVAMLASGAGPGGALVEVASLMRAAGLDPGGRYLVLAVSAEADRVASPNADRWRCDLAEELTAPLGGRTLAAPAGDEVAVLIPLEAQASQEQVAAALQDVQPVLDAARIRLSVGVSAPVQGVGALSGALHEADSARRLAEVRATTALSLVTSDEVTSHELLLASVPASVLRSFRERLLGPLLAYDERHRAELMPTLREFLACSGSWNACAATMYVHVNTVRYRIRRIEELTGRDLSCLADQVDFFLALQVR